MKHTLPTTEEEVVPYIRRVLYDASSDGCMACSLMGFVPPDEDQRMREHDDSDARLERIDHLIEHIAGTTEWLAKFVVRHQIVTAVSNGAPQPPFGMEEMAIDIYKEAMTACSVAVVSALVDTGMLEVVDHG